MLAFSAVLVGQPGSVTVHTRDSEGAQGSSLLTPDSLEINLSAGPMASLAFEESGRLQCGVRDCIGAIKLLAVDAAGNLAACEPFEVTSLYGAEACALNLTRLQGVSKDRSVSKRLSGQGSRLSTSAWQWTGHTMSERTSMHAVSGQVQALCLLHVRQDSVCR